MEERQFDEEAYRQMIELQTKVIARLNPVMPAFDLANSRRVKIDENIDEPPVVLSIRNEAIEAVMATVGNLTVVTGKAKSKKSSFLKLLCGSVLNPNNDSIIRLKTKNM